MADVVIQSYTGKQKKSSGGQIPRVQPKKFAGRLRRPENFSASHAAPGYKMTKIFLPMGYPWYTPRVVSLVLSCQDWLPRDHFWDFSWFFLNFPGFFQFFTNFYPKICRPPSAAENFFRPWVVDPYLNFFTHSTKTTQGCYPTLFFYPRYSTKKNFLPWVHTPPTVRWTAWKLKIFFCIFGSSGS